MKEAAWRLPWRLAPRPEFELLHRYETRLHMQYQRALHNFLLVRQACMPKEPSPIFERQADPLAAPPPAPLALAHNTKEGTP